jgi:predicted HAD superfamily Cof-like phosphohydrolase
VSEEIDMSMDWMSDMIRLHVNYKHPVGDLPAFSSREDLKLRFKLIQEEAGETLDAIVKRDLPELADGIVDTIVVLIGTAVACGIDLRPLWDAVLAANLAKVKDGILRNADGKVQKPPGWQRPDIAGLLKQQSLLMR